MAAYEPVRSVAWVLRVLGEVNERDPVGASDVATRAGFSQPPFMRALETLAAEG
jgi:DNA-binding IclR family transcriptional regulator